MQNLIAEMARYKIKTKDIQKLLNCSKKTIYNKIHGKTEFTYLEAQKIKNEFFPHLSLEYLFSSSPSKTA